MLNANQKLIEDLDRHNAEEAARLREEGFEIPMVAKVWHGFPDSKTDGICKDAIPSEEDAVITYDAPPCQAFAPRPADVFLTAKGAAFAEREKIRRESLAKVREFPRLNVRLMAAAGSVRLGY